MINPINHMQIRFERETSVSNLCLDYKWGMVYQEGYRG